MLHTGGRIPVHRRVPSSQTRYQQGLTKNVRSPEKVILEKDRTGYLYGRYMDLLQKYMDLPCRYMDLVCGYMDLQYRYMVSWCRYMDFSCRYMDLPGKNEIADFGTRRAPSRGLYPLLIIALGTDSAITFPSATIAQH